MSLPTSMPAWQFSHTKPTLEKGLGLNQTAPVPALPGSKTPSSLVKVLTAGLNPVDYKMAEIPYVGGMATGGRPSTPGIDYVGRVWKTSVPGLKAGDLVFGKLEGPGKHGTLAEFIVVSGEEGIVKVPSGFEAERLDELGCVGVAGATALQSLKSVDVDAGGVSGGSVFINGGSGGTGTFGVQIAKFGLGCADVVASCSSANVQLVKDLGADEVIDYKTTDVLQGLKGWSERHGGKKFDLIVDNVGHDMTLYWQAHQYLKEGGKFVLVGMGVSFGGIAELLKIFLWPTMLGGGKRPCEVMMAKSDKVGFERMGEWMKEGKVKAIIDETFEMQDAPKAFEKLRVGRTRGKIAVKVSEDGR